MEGCDESDVGEGGEGKPREAKAEVRLEVKLERSLGCLQMCLPRMAYKKGMEHLVDFPVDLTVWETFFI